MSSMYTVYILKNQKGRHYIGYTKNLTNRLRKHNSGDSSYTKKRGPWKVVYQERYQSKKEAFKRERQIKSFKGGEAFKKLKIV